MFYNNFDNVYGEDRYGMVGKTGDGFREDRLLEIPCYRCHQRYQIVVSCTHCGAVDQFIVNDGREKQIGRLQHAHVRPSEHNLA